MIKVAGKMMDRLKHAWNAFNDHYNPVVRSFGLYSTRPDRTRLSVGNEKSIVSTVYNRLSLDIASMDLKHVRLDQNGKYLEDINSYLNDCLTVSANIDQTGRAFLQDVALSLFDEGCVAIVPVETTVNPILSGGYDILSLRTGSIQEWFPDSVRVRLYNEKTGLHEEVTLPKSTIAIVENPLYTVMNEPNSTLKRLISKLNLLDSIDDQSSSGKLDLIIQLPYVIKSQSRQEQANARKKDIEDQLKNSKYGIAYIDGAEKITQLNRPANNNLMEQITYLTALLYSQLGITESIMDGTADEATMNNYFTRTIEPIVNAIAEEMHRKFLTKTARTQKQCIMAMRDPFRFVPVTELATMADRLTRNEILSSNEVRSIICFKPSGDPRADQLVNKNIAQPDAAQNGNITQEPTEKDEKEGEEDEE